MCTYEGSTQYFILIQNIAPFNALSIRTIVSLTMFYNIHMTINEALTIKEEKVNNLLNELKEMDKDIELDKYEKKMDQLKELKKKKIDVCKVLDKEIVVTFNDEVKFKTLHNNRMAFRLLEFNGNQYWFMGMWASDLMNTYILSRKYKGCSVHHLNPLSKEGKISQANTFEENWKVIEDIAGEKIDYQF